MPLENTDNELRFNVSPMQRGILLVCITALCYIIAGVISAIVFHRGVTGARVCIATVMQDVIVFILPAIATAMLITRRPADFLSIRRNPGVTGICLTALLLIMSIPAMNVIITWNASLELPGEIGEWMRNMENSAAETISMMINGQSVMSLIMLILVVGIFAGLSEELFFRGCIQRMMITARVNPHVAIWLTAVVFSAIHLQFYGFVPRLLLGALFGYLAWWSGTVWTSVAAHVFNNVLAAVTMWMKDRDESSGVAQLDNYGTENPMADIASLLLVAVCLCVIYRLYSGKKIIPAIPR